MDARDALGIRCPRCGCGHFWLVYVRKIHGGRVMRRRECRHCGRRVTTYETCNFIPPADMAGG